MKACILCAIIIVVMTNGARAQNQINQNSLITTYDPGEASLESPHFTSNGEITAEERRPKNKGHIRFEGQNPERPIKFKDNPKEQGYDDIDIDALDSILAEDNEISFKQNNRVSDTGTYENESSSSENKIKFEDSNDEQENSDNQYGNDKVEDLQGRGNKIVFEDDDNYEKYLDESEIVAESIDRPIKFENQYPESYVNKRDSDRNSVTERVVFKDDAYQSQQPAQKKKRKPRRKPGFGGKPTNARPTGPNSPYPGLDYPGYPGYPGPSYPSPGDQNTGYPSYPKPGSPNPGHPYPNYNSHNPGFPSTYPSNYPPIGQGYGLYPLPGFPEDQRPPVGPAAYPSSGQGDPNRPDKYPYQEYGGSPSPTGPQNGQGRPDAGPDYPYNQGNPANGYPPPYPYDPYAQYPPQGQSQYRPPVYPGPHQPGYPYGLQRPSRRPKSLTERAVSAVAEALTSIALYDDQQCVPRILCETAGGSTASSPTLLKASASLQPLLTLLQAYNGVSTSPLYVFGRATVTGITAKGNPSACYRAYPQCPRDPEKLINYLNNHNGGFFRFFGQPDNPQQTHNLEQFYNYLSGQNGLPQQQQQGYGFLKPNGYGFPPQNPYAQSYNYGQNDYNKQFSNRNANSIESEVKNGEARIQNKPVGNIIEADSDLSSDESQFTSSKWSFPDEGNKNSYGRDKVKIRKQPERGSKTLKFPDDRYDYRREVQTVRDYTTKENIYFPGHSNFQNYVNYYETTTPVNPDEYYFDHKHNFYVKREKALKTDDVVYVVRGNGDPNHPEVIRLRPGQTI